MNRGKTSISLIALTIAILLILILHYTYSIDWKLSISIGLLIITIVLVCIVLSLGLILASKIKIKGKNTTFKEKIMKVTKLVIYAFITIFCLSVILVGLKWINESEIQENIKQYYWEINMQIEETISNISNIEFFLILVFIIIFLFTISYQLDRCEKRISEIERKIKK